MSTDEEPRATDPTDDTHAELRDIETKPLSERAPDYQQLADRLREELEHSDPSREPS